MRELAGMGLFGWATAAALWAQTVAFNVPQRDYAAGGDPIAIAMGDFNGDGKLDVVMSLSVVNGQGGVVVLAGNGKGGFGAPVVSTTNGESYSLAAADLNGDGKLDIATLAQPGVNAIAIQLGNGDGTFQAPVNYPVAGTPGAVAIADFNHDGKLDLVTFCNNRVNSFVSLLLGKGDGTFQAGLNFYAPAQIVGLVIGDFNHDGNPDVAVASTPSYVSVLLGTGAGSFLPAYTSYVGPVDLLSLAAGDLNGDGNEDLVVNPKPIQHPTQTYVLLGNGDGSFQMAVSQAFPAFATAIADMNQDGKADLVGVNDTNFAVVLQGNGDGTFSGAPSLTPVGAIPYGPVLGKFRSGTVAPDLVTANLTGTVSILYNKGNGTFVVPRSLAIGSGTNAVASGDFNHDGIRDLVTVEQGQNRVSILLGKGDGTFQAASNYAVGKGPASVVVRDFNNDGKQDLAVCNGVGVNTISILLGNGDGTFQPAKTVPAGGPIETGKLAAADFNRDGKQDLVVNSQSANALLVLLGNGDGTFQPAKSVAAGLGPQFAATADLNHDGKADLIAGGSSALSVLLGNGDGTFQAAQVYSGLPDYVAAGAVGDLNGDGNPDVVVAGYSEVPTHPTGVYVLMGSANGTLGTPSGYAVTTPFDVVLADFNHDGKLDAAVANNGGNNVPVMLGNGDGTFGAATYYPSGSGVPALTAVDLNNDQKADLAIAGAPGLIVLLNKTP